MTHMGSTTDHKSEQQTTQITYLPGLDGIRALAVVAVLLYHAGYNLPGGYLGVESFFVLSGFLITALLVVEWQQHGRINIPRFWLRRARRLLPALIAMLLGTLLLGAILLPRELRSLGGDILAALFYVMNIKLIIAQQSYFDALERPPLLQHLWSLAVEEQFYLFWPLLFSFGMRLIRPVGVLIGVLAAIAASTALMVVLYDPGSDPSRVYYGTDTRAAAIFIGAALALVWTSERRAALSGRWSTFLEACGFGGLVALLGAYVWLYEQHPLLYYGGFQLVAFATALIIAATTLPGARLLPKLLEAAPLRWIGVRSYSLYLWHWPIFVAIQPGTDFSARGLPLNIACFGLTVALSALSYRFVEQPIRALGVAGAWAEFRSTIHGAAPVVRSHWRAALFGTCGLVVATVAALLMVQQPMLAAPTSRLTAVPISSTATSVAFGAAAVRPTGAAIELQATALAPCDSAATLPERKPCVDATALPATENGTPPNPPPTALPTDPALDPAIAADLQQLLDETVADGYIPGAVLSVYIPGYAPWSGASGLANRDQEVVMQPDTPVRIASVSKMFTAVVVLQLVEEGVITLDAPVATWLPERIPNADTITVRQLLQHTSGLYDYLEDRNFVAQTQRNPEEEWLPQDLVDYAARFPSGRVGRWDYSSTNYVILGMLVEQATGQPLAQHIRQRIFEPLGMQHAAFLPQEATPEAMAHGYTNGTDITNASMSFAFATGSIAMTADDLQRFGRGLFTQDLLRGETRDLMFEFVSGRGQYDMPDLAYGLGVMQNRLPIDAAPSGSSRSRQANLVLGHIGGYGGFRSALWYAPDSGVVIAVGLNQAQADPNDLATATLSRLLASISP